MQLARARDNASVRLLFVMDPPEALRAETDTTVALLQAAQRRGHPVAHAQPCDVRLQRDRLRVACRTARVTQSPRLALELGERRIEDVENFDAVFVRKDPPFDADYLWLTLLLEHARGRSVVVNDPRALREANEKLYALHFPALVPETLVAADPEAIAQFVDEVGGRAVVKPVDGHAGLGVFLLARGDPNFHALVERQTDGGRRLAVVQRYLPEVARGDKRVLLLDGEPLGAMLRVPRADELRSNLRVGGRAEPCGLDDDDRRIVEALGPRLRADGLFFVGIDVIGGRLTEVNVTSPTGLRQMMEASGEDLAGRVLDRLAARVRER
ncbi:MAG: glutathione synthase [Myxococcota bacterium]|nr:glutathione synthase [Myxococcota bacterium]MDW8363759.1 glutathione synthase [Myxococcales bacterium]